MLWFMFNVGMETCYGCVIASIVCHASLSLKEASLQVQKDGLVTCPKPRRVSSQIYKGGSGVLKCGPGLYEEPNVELVPRAYELVSLSLVT